MDIERLIIIGAIIIIAIPMTSAIKVLADNQRLAQFKAGRFVKFLGPGLVLQFDTGLMKWKRITVGTIGEYISSEMGRFEDRKGKFFDLPVEMADSARIGNLIRITGFTKDKALCILNPEQRKTIQCEKCGHRMAIS